MSPRAPQPEGPLLTHLLREVSRSFYLTLRVLPTAVRPQVSLAYLLARTTDTIADTAVLPAEDRLSALRALQDRIQGRSTAAVDFGRYLAHQASTAESRLLQRAEDALELLDRQDPEDRRLIRQVIDTIASGQMLDLVRFANAGPRRIVALETAEELEDYTWRVAGCVGEFWTRICLRHLLPGDKVSPDFLLARGLRFGQGLQMVNILRDLAADLRSGRCYLPARDLSAVSLEPLDLLSPSNEPRLRPVYSRYLEVTAGHLAAGWEYTNHLPRSCVRLRLACAWPILLGVRTVSLLRQGRVLDPEARIRVPRAEVRRLVVRSLCAVPFPGGWDRLYRRCAA